MLPSECVPDITETMTLKDLERVVNSFNDIMSNIDNFHLKNAFLYGKWLDYAFDIFHFEKELGNVTFRSFEEWVQARTKVGKRRAYSLRNLAKLEKIVPRILRCKKPVDFFVRNHRQLITYFRGNDAPEPWYHSINSIIAPVINVQHIFLCSDSQNSHPIQTLNHLIVYLISRSQGITLLDCTVSKSPCIIVQLGNHPTTET